MTRPTPKVEKQRGRSFAEGGATHMLGKGTRTRTATEDAAGTQMAGQTAMRSKDNLSRAKGGRRIDDKWGIAYPAQPGMCGPAKSSGRR
jgi:hypothetical protein